MLKTNRSMKKRIRVTGSGKFKRTRANKGHILTKKTRKRKRNLRRSAYVDKTEVAKVRRMLPYG
jgi:large subunit ribosomal protein L35